MDVRTHGTCLRTNPKETPRHFKRFAGVFFSGELFVGWLRAVVAATGLPRTPRKRRLH